MIHQSIQTDPRWILEDKLIRAAKEELHRQHAQNFPTRHDIIKIVVQTVLDELGIRD